MDFLFGNDLFSYKDVTVYFGNFLVLQGSLMGESDSFILQFLNELNLIYRRLSDFVVSFYFIPVVLVPWGRFPLCHTFIRPILFFQDQISILIVSYVTTWSRGSHHHPFELGLRLISVVLKCLSYSIKKPTP